MLNQRRHGFTLIELMVTLAVAGVLLVGAIPLVREWLMNLEIRNAAESIASGLSKARSEAVKRNQPVMFSLVSSTSAGTLDADCQLSPRSASWVVSLEDPSGACDRTAGVGGIKEDKPRLLDKHASGDGSPSVVVGVYDASCSNSTGATQVSFNGYGRMNDDPEPMRCIVVRHPRSDTTHTLRVMVGTGGTVRTCDPAVTDRDDPRTCIPT